MKYALALLALAGCCAPAPAREVKALRWDTTLEEARAWTGEPGPAFSHEWFSWHAHADGRDYWDYPDRIYFHGGRGK